MSATATGLVTAAWRRHYAVRLEGGETIRCVLRGRHLAVACGDSVRVALGADGEGAINAVQPRRTLLFRSDAHREKLIAANVTQILGIVAPDPPYDDELVQRWIVAALVKLYEDNATTLTPDPVHSAFYDSHPPAASRIARLQPAAA